MPTQRLKLLAILLVFACVAPAEADQRGAAPQAASRHWGCPHARARAEAAAAAAAKGGWAPKSRTVITLTERLPSDGSSADIGGGSGMLGP